MTWGTEVVVSDAAASDTHFALLEKRLPKARAAYVPSGKLPAGGLVALLAGGVVSSVVAALTGVLVGAISLALFALLGLLVAVVAACGFVACITLIWGLGIVVFGGGATFGGLGWVAGALTAWFGKLGKNRNVPAAVTVGFLSCFGAWGAVACLPPLLAALVAPSEEDFSLGGLVHLFGDYGWPHAVVLLLGLAFALLMAFVGAEDTVKGQKFCEPCEAHMAERRVPGASLAIAEQLRTLLEAGDTASVASLLSTESGRDVEPTLHVCPRCGSGFLDARLWARTTWTEGGKQKRSEREWLTISQALTASQMLPLSRLPERHESGE